MYHQITGTMTTASGMIHPLAAETRTDAERQANELGAVSVRWAGERWRKIEGEWVVIS